METCRWGFALVTVALLLDPTFADILVQPGYNQPRLASKNTVADTRYVKNQQVQNPQENYFSQGNPPLQMLQQQHKIQQQYLQQQHQQERNQLLQLQQQQLQNPAILQPQTRTAENVGSPWGLPYLPPMIPGPFGGAHGGRVFSLGPLGLNSLTLGGLGGLIPPLLLSPHQTSEMAGSAQFQKSVDESSQARAKRDVRDSGDPTERKFRQKSSRSQQDAMAANPPLKSKLESGSPSARTGKKNDEIVGGAHKENEENVGSSLLDPLGLIDKAENMMGDLTSGHLPNPLNGLRQGLLPGFPGFLNKPNPGNGQFEEHVVGESQQHQYPPQGKSNNEYTTMNQQRFQSQQSREPVVGDVRHTQYPNRYFSPAARQYGPQIPYGAYQQRYPPFDSSWMRRYNSMSNRGNGMSYPGYPMIGAQSPAARQFGGQTNWDNAMSGSQNPAVQNPSLKVSGAGSNSNGYGKSRGGENPTVGKAQVMTEKTDDGIVTAPNPAHLSSKQSSWDNSQGYNQMVGGPSPMDNFYQGQSMRGAYNPMAGSAAPGQWTEGGTPFNYGPGQMGGETPMPRGPPFDNSYDQGRQNNYRFNDGQQRHRHFPFGFDEMFDDGYNHHNHGGFNRLYDTFVDEIPFGYGDGNPYYTHNHQSYFL